MDLFQIVTAINNTGFTNKQLDEIATAVKYARASLSHHVAKTLKPGDRVRFKGRGGVVHTGLVNSIKIKNAIVVDSTGRYRVPMSMLEVA
jgi:hypothetical protein